MLLTKQIDWDRIGDVAVHTNPFDLFLSPFLCRENKDVKFIALVRKKYVRKGSPK